MTIRGPVNYNVMRLELELRPADEADAHCLAALAIQVWLHTYAYQGIRASIADYVLSEFAPKRFLETIRSSQSRIVVAERSGHLVGYSRLQTGNKCPSDVDAQVELVNLYVQVHFTRAGVGTRLLRESEQIAREIFGSSLWLTVNANNKDAVAFYRSQKYREIGIDYFELKGERHMNYVLVQSTI